MLFALIVGILWAVGVPLPAILPGFGLVPEWWGLTLTLTYLAQALVSHLVERRYEREHAARPVLDHLVSVRLLAAQHTHHRGGPAARAGAAAPLDLGKPGSGIAMSRRPQESWPPLIVASEKPRWVFWRDFALTLAMWLMFAIILETEFELFFGRYLERLGWGDFDTNANWARFFQRLEPYLWLIVMLVALLAASTVATLHRLRRFLKQAQPPPLLAIEEAHRGRMEAAALLAARELANVVVHVTADGAHRVEPRQAPLLLPRLRGRVGRGQAPNAIWRIADHDLKSEASRLRLSPSLPSPVRRGRR